MSGRVLALLGDSFHASGGIAQFNRDLIAAWAEKDSVTEIVLVPRFATGSRSDLPGKVVERPPVSSLILYVLSAALESIRESAKVQGGGGKKVWDSEEIYGRFRDEAKKRTLQSLYVGPWQPAVRS